MSRVETLALLSDVIDSLEPIGTMRSGEPLRAGDWNAVVKAVTQLAKMMVSREQTTEELLSRSYATRDHTHTGDVTITWFEPHSRALVEEGLQGAVEHRVALREVRENLDRLRSRMEDVRSGMAGLRVQLDGLRDNDSAREREITKVETRVETLQDIELSMGDLTRRFNGIASSVEEALVFRDQLQDDEGRLVDIGRLDSRIGQLEEMRENLMLASGDVVHIREIESAIARLEENAINRNDVDDVILERLREGDLLDETNIIASAVETIEERLTPKLNDIESKVALIEEQAKTFKAGMDDQQTSLAGLDGRMNAAESKLDVMATLNTRVDDYGLRISSLEGRVNGHDSTLSGLPALRGRLEALETATTPLKELPSTVQKLGERTGQLESKFATMDAVINDVYNNATRVGAVEAKLPSLEAARQQVTVNTQQLSTIDSRVGANEAELDNLAEIPVRVEALGSQLDDVASWRTNTNARLDDLSKQQESDRVVALRVDALNRRISQNSQNIQSVKSMVTSTRSQLGELRSSYDTLNTRVETIESRRGDVE